MVCVAASVDDVTVDISSRLNSEYRYTLSSQIQPNAAKPIGWSFRLQIDNESKHITKPTGEFLSIHQWQSHQLILTPRCILFSYRRQN